MEEIMSSTDTVMLNPKIVGQLEKRHEAILKKILAGTSLDEKQWITVQVALGAGQSIAHKELVGRVSRLSTYEPAVVEAAISGLIDGYLVEALEVIDGQLAVTSRGRELVSALRARVQDFIGPAYESIAPEDLATAGRVVSAIAARLSDALATSDLDQK
jgi:hypothetical protein